MDILMCNITLKPPRSLFCQCPPSSGLHFNQVRFSSSINPISRKRSALIMAESLQNPGTEQQKIVIPNKHGEKLVGLLHDTGSKEVVILCHGFRCTKEVHVTKNLALALEKEGISAYRFDFSGNGESEGAFQYGNYHWEADDLHSVTHHFSDANRAVIAILGHSKGGDVVLLYASKYHDVPSVVNLSGRYNLKRGIEERLGKDFMERLKQQGFIDVKDKSRDVEYRVTEQSMMDRLNTDMHEASLKIDKECRVLTVHGSADEIIPVEDAYEFAKIIPNHKLHVIEGADHAYNNYQAELHSVVVEFIKAGMTQNC